MLRSNRRGFALIEIVIVVAVIAILAAFIYPRYLSGGRDSTGGKVAAPKERAEGVECMSYLSQARSALNMYEQTNEQRPQSLADLSTFGMTAEMMKCPVTGLEYSYDPNQGVIWCSSPGHENY